MKKICYMFDVIKLKKIFEEKGLSIPKTAKKAQINRTLLWRYLNQKRTTPDFDTIASIAWALDISPFDLIKEKGGGKEYGKN